MRRGISPLVFARQLQGMGRDCKLVLRHRPAGACVVGRARNSAQELLLASGQGLLICPCCGGRVSHSLLKRLLQTTLMIRMSSHVFGLLLQIGPAAASMR
jgi:hypothetical protein